MKDSAATPGRHAGSADEPSPVATGLEALSWAVSSGAAGEVVRHVETRRRRRVRRRIAGVAGIACLGLVGAWLFPQAAATLAVPPIAAASTVVVAPETRTLADGSIVELRPGAEIWVEYGSSSRRVVLLAGEVHFQVTKDAARPFVVVASGVEVRAVGTAFSVDLGKRAVDVLVTEGRVAVTSPPATVEATPAVAMVDAGQGTTVSLEVAGAAAVRSVPSGERRERLNWRVPLLEFSSTPLAEAIPMFNRHDRHHLVLDPALGRLQLSGTLRADDTDSLFILLRNEFGIIAAPGSAGHTELRRP
jgi:transmembrane sensor